MNRIILILTFLIFVSISGNSQQSLKGFSKLYKNDLPKAYTIFKETLLENEEDLVANYGMGVIFSNNSYYRHDYFAAFRYIRMSKTIVNKSNDSELSEINKTIPDIKKKILQDYDTIEKKLYDSVMKNQSLNSVEIFANEFSDSKYFKEIVQIRDHKEYNEILKKDSLRVSDLNQYIERFPYSSDCNKAIDFRDQLAYQDLCKNISLSGTYDYLKRYPESAYISKVSDFRDSLEFLNASQKNSMDAYGYYLSHFINSKYTKKAIDGYIQKYYEEVQEKNSIKDYQEFLNRFMGSEKAEPTLRLRDYIIFQNIQATGTVDTYNQFITWYPNSPKIKEAIQLRDQKAFEDAIKTKTIAGLEEFINQYPSAPQRLNAFHIRDSILIDNISKLVDVSLIDQYLYQYPTLAQNPNVLKIKASLAFKAAEKENNKETWERFLLYYSGTEFEVKAKERLNRLK